MRLMNSFTAVMILLWGSGALAQTSSAPARSAEGETSVSARRAPRQSTSDANEPFFAERYLGWEQRLARRQQRILQVLKSPDPLSTAGLSR